MKTNGLQRCYLEGNMLIFIEDGRRSARGFQTDREAAEAYNALPEQHHEPQWPITTRKEASGRGDKHYYTGKLCVNNHDDLRYVASGGACVTCHTNNQRASQRRAAGVKPGQTMVRLPVYSCKVEELRAYVQSINEAHGHAECETCGTKEVS